MRPLFEGVIALASYVNNSPFPLFLKREICYSLDGQQEQKCSFSFFSKSLIKRRAMTVLSCEKLCVDVHKLIPAFGC